MEVWSSGSGPWSVSESLHHQQDVIFRVSELLPTLCLSFAIYHIKAFEKYPGTHGGFCLSHAKICRQMKDTKLFLPKSHKSPSKACRRWELSLTSYLIFISLNYIRSLLSVFIFLVAPKTMICTEVLFNNAIIDAN